ncbi:MAG: hypothetical protein GDA50_07530 [Alphaproteobacteria bacterium GM202ARS2]|nr:hypothetical protein [Alphaproteobacteria bacterium GM202ARS2]
MFQFPKVHTQAVCRIDFQRTLRIPDDNQEYPLPPGLGSFPINHVDDFTDNLPATWKEHGGVFIPMYQAEALWMNFSGHYPCAIKIAAGKINAVSGTQWTKKLSNRPQDYVVVPDQPWLDGFNVSKGCVRQFVAMPLGEGYTAEEQLTGDAEHGGIQIIVYPMKHDVYVKYMEQHRVFNIGDEQCLTYAPADEMGLGAGGVMRQEIYEDDYGIDSWDQTSGLRCFVHLTNSAIYQKITGHPPLHKPPTAQEYTDSGLPWFDYYADKKALQGSASLSQLTSVAAKKIQKGEGTLDNNENVHPNTIKTIKKGRVVRDGRF